MKSAYIIHGCCDKEEYFSEEYPSPSNFHWLPWIQKQLLMKGYFCQTPEMPEPYQAQYSDWKKAFEIFPVDKNTSLVGHSCSCGFFLRWLTETDHVIDKLVLVAPWIDPKLPPSLNPDLKNRINEIHVFYSDDEKTRGVKEAVENIMEAYPQTTLHRFQDKRHFTLRSMKTDQFPELLKLFD